MYDQIVQGQLKSSNIDSIPSVLNNVDVDELPSPAASLASKDSCAFLLPITGVKPLQPLRHKNMKRKLTSTDSGVEFNCQVTNRPINYCKNNHDSIAKMHHPSFGEITDLSSTYNLSKHLTNTNTMEFNEVCDSESSGLYSASTSNYSQENSDGNSKFNDDDDEAMNDDSVFKSTEQSGNYLQVETFNKMVDVSTTQHIIRPETLHLDGIYFDHSETVDGKSNDDKLSIDSGHGDIINSSEVVIDTERDLQFNNNGYLTSPVFVGEDN